ncbi:hypothetical protein NIA69_04680 [Gemmiger formicilis]|nr:hypothetical protein [Gemmiger formicilis]
MGLITTIQNKTEQARAKERIRPLLESRMMRDILLEIGQRGTEKLDPRACRWISAHLHRSAPPSAAPRDCSRASSGRSSWTRPPSRCLPAATRCRSSTATTITRPSTTPIVCPP